MHMLTCPRCQGLTPSHVSRNCLHCETPLAAPRWAIRLTALLGPAGAILLAACYGAPYRAGDANYAQPSTMRYDRDGDGVQGAAECNDPQRCQEDMSRLPPNQNVDCDDGDARRFPGAGDIAGDGVDQNCDGIDGVRDPGSPPATIATPPATP